MITTAPPPIPACRKGEAWDAREHLIMWVHTGTGHVRLPNGQDYRVEAGTGVWLPPGSDHEMWTEPGTLAFPTWIAPEAVPDAPTHVTRFTVDPAWRDWLIAQYAYAITRSQPSLGRQVSPGDLVSLLDSSGPQVSRGGGAVDPGHQPPMPRSAAARKVARELLRNPALDHTVDEWAILASCSANTLRRDFLVHTGMTFAQWRNVCRLTAAGELLADGYEVAQVAARTGFATRNGFTRAFKEHHGMTPRDYAAHATTQDGARLRGGGAARSRSVRTTQSASSVYQYNELSWIYRGEGWARVGTTTYPRTKGDTIWLPAGMENETGLPEGALALPLSVLDADDIRLTEPLRARFPASWDTYLLYCSVSTNTLLRPETYDPRHILEVFSGQLAVERARTVPMPKDARAREAATDFLRHIGTPTESTTYVVPGDILDAFRLETGMTFASWRRAARMRIARDLLARGAKPSIVAGRVGYSQVSNFSRAFSQFHGVSPREHRERELDVS